MVMGVAAAAPWGVDDATGALDEVPEGLDDAPQAETTSARRGTPSDTARFEPIRKRGTEFTCRVPLTAVLTDVVGYGYGQGLRDPRTRPPARRCQSTPRRPSVTR